jgi:hypothetical protein
VSTTVFPLIVAMRFFSCKMQRSKKSERVVGGGEYYVKEINYLKNFSGCKNSNRENSGKKPKFKEENNSSNNNSNNK